MGVNSQARIAAVWMVFGLALLGCVDTETADQDAGGSSGADARPDEANRPDASPRDDVNRSDADLDSGGPTDTPGDLGTGEDDASDVGIDVARPDVPPDMGEPDVPETDAANPDTGGGGDDECTLGQGACTTWDTAVRCEETPQGARWVEQDCPGGVGCFQGGCVADKCSDECHLGQTDGDRRCEAWDMEASRWVGGGDGLHDRARAYEKWLRDDTHSLLHGGLVSVRYQTNALREPDRVYFGDTPLHTGLYLAAEAQRLEATGSPRARKNVKQMVETFRLWFDVSGDPGNLATIAARAGDRRLRDWSLWDCDDFDRFCNIDYRGERWDYVGDPSRDMYMGPAIGLPLAYDALGEHDEEHREMIRHDLVTVAEELVRLRTLQLVVTINGFSFPEQQVQTRFFIPESRDTLDGAIHLSVDLDDIDNSGDVRGGQEFLPNPTRLLEQIALVDLLLGNQLPDIPRSSSALMVPALLQAALHVTDGVPAYAARREALRTFYYENDDEWGNVDTWLEAASQWANDRECGERYFGINLAMIPVYVFSRYETSDAHRRRLGDEVLHAKLWDYVDDHRNAFFSFIYAAEYDGADPGVATAAARDLRDFPAPPRIRREVDERGGRYGRMDGCSSDIAARAVDLEDRPVKFFQWHSSPWELLDRGSERQTYPGHDYLLAYWMGRSHGFIEDDAAGTCLRWR